MSHRLGVLNAFQPMIFWLAIGLTYHAIVSRGAFVLFILIQQPNILLLSQILTSSLQKQ